MKRIAIVLFAVAVVGLAGMKLITEKQGLVTAALSELGFEAVKSEVIGGPQKYKVTKETLKTLTEGTVVVVENDGSVTIKEAKGK